MIGIATITGNSAGDLIINELSSSRIYDASARVSRSKTLDGGVIIDHQGFAAGDRTLQIDCELTEAEETILRNIFEGETLIHISTPTGFYQGAIRDMSGDNGNIRLNILIKGTT